jgi:NAD(P)-dependent dehydrogenase (short-subunit alcohol dehydrogenase family)
MHNAPEIASFLWNIMDLSGKVVLVTGGATRLGGAISVSLAQRGCHVVVHYHRSGREARALVRDLKCSGCTALSFAADLAKSADVDRLVPEVVKAAGRLDILVNNAAVFYKAPILATKRRQWVSEWQINALAPALLARAFAAQSDKNPNKQGATDIVGKIVNILDQRVHGAQGGCASYLLSKKWLAAFTEAAAIEFAPRVTVNAVAPGAVLPPATDRGHASELAGSRLLRCRPSPKGVASAVVFLLESDSITGQTIYVDSGQRLAPPP